MLQGFALVQGKTITETGKLDQEDSFNSRFSKEGSFLAELSEEDYGINRTERQFFVGRRPPARINPAAAFLIPAIPTFVGLGAGLAWIASLRVPITTNISGIGSPSTNVTVTSTNQGLFILKIHYDNFPYIQRPFEKRY